MNAKIAVVAGTPVDSNMGVEFLKSKDPELSCQPVYTAADPRGGHLFQLSSMEHKEKELRRMFSACMEDGIRDFFIYCNSLSAAFDFDSLAEKMGIRVYTPLQVYRELGPKYKKLAVIAANCQSCRGIEAFLTERNHMLEVDGLGILSLVEAVEAKLTPKEIMERFHMDSLLRFYEGNGAEALILGCTHYPYFQEEISTRTNLPIINPADIMFDNLMNALR